MPLKFITPEYVKRRNAWVNRINNFDGQFELAAQTFEQELNQEIKNFGQEALIGHLRLCGVIPEIYIPSSTEEKLYSKYTDTLLHLAYTAMGFRSIVLAERADSADVEAVNNDIGFVADAKAFRLSRTAKNQKDFKVQAMDTWKYGKPYAMLVSPIYQLPSRKSQIYKQASTRSVLITTYTHLAVLIRYANDNNHEKSMQRLKNLFEAVDAMNPSNDSITYWQIINRTFLEFDETIKSIWLEEKQATLEAIQVAKEEALNHLARERERILRLSQQEAIHEILNYSRIDSKINKINSVASNGLLDLG